ncbi:MAG: protein-glutamate O-methyltransferase CheR [Bacteroidales bacterium]|nr:protein-glutamate O-methyltransferase CheR [Bacteroidales bacterium]
MNKAELDRINQSLMQRHGLSIHVYEDTFVHKSIQQQMLLNNCSNLDEYAGLISGSLKESSELFDRLTNSHSEFFRNTMTFALIEHVLLPEIFHQSTNHEMRIWSAGCAAGQEPYSVAILAHEYLKTQAFKKKVRIFASDISEKNLTKARNAQYTSSSLKQLRLGLLENNFDQKSAVYTLKHDLKEMVDFSFYNLVSEGLVAPPASLFGNFDLILCCNVMIYYKPYYQQMILAKIQKSLVAGGYFVCGESETALLAPVKGFKQAFGFGPVFKKTANS